MRSIPNSYCFICNSFPLLLTSNSIYRTTFQVNIFLSVHKSIDQGFKNEAQKAHSLTSWISVTTEVGSHNSPITRHQWRNSFSVHCFIVSPISHICMFLIDTSYDKSLFDLGQANIILMTAWLFCQAISLTFRYSNGYTEDLQIDNCGLRTDICKMASSLSVGIVVYF